MRNFLLIFALLLSAPYCAAKQAVPLADDPVLEAHVMRIAQDLRCLVCQNETLAASHAGLAVDLRNQIRSKLVQGQSDRQIVDFMVQRYGDFVLYRPPFKATTWLLWIGPFVLLLLALYFMARFIVQRNTRIAPLPLSAQQERQAHRLLDAGKET